MRAWGAVVALLAAGCSTSADDGQVTLAFAGDVHTRSPVELADPAYEEVFAPLRRADIAMVNLESALTNGGTVADKRYIFRADPSVVDRLGELGIDVVTMANNHALDHGRDGLRETLALRADSPTVDIIGVGRDVADAFRPARVTVRGTTVTFLTSKLDDDPTADPTIDWAATPTKSGVASASDPARLLDAVRDVRSDGPVVVFLHWGVQGDLCPSSSQSTLARSLRRAGADVIVGAHSHTVQGMGPDGRAFVAYGLGNFVWWRPGRDGGVLTVTLKGETTTAARWQPVERTRSRLVPTAGDVTSAMRPLSRHRCDG